LGPTAGSVTYVPSAIRIQPIVRIPLVTHIRPDIGILPSLVFVRSTASPLFLTAVSPAEQLQKAIYGVAREFLQLNMLLMQGLPPKETLAKRYAAISRGVWAHAFGLG